MPDGVVQWLAVAVADATRAAVLAVPIGAGGGACPCQQLRRSIRPGTRSLRRLLCPSFALMTRFAF